MVNLQSCSEIRDACLSHMLERLEATEPRRDPYPHFWAERFLPDDIYRRLLAESPDDSLFDGSSYDRKQKSGSVNRLRMDLVRETIGSLSEETKELWCGVRDAFGAPALKRGVFIKLAEGLSYRFGIPPEEAADIHGFPRPALYREREGYFIKPHPDTRRKIVTLQLALCRDETQKDLGTSLYRRSAKLRHLAQREPRGFCEVGRYPFLPNSVFAFTVINSLRLKSWHGRATLPPGSGVRDTLLQIYYADAADANPEIVEQQYAQLRAA